MKTTWHSALWRDLSYTLDMSTPIRDQMGYLWRRSGYNSIKSESTQYGPISRVPGRDEQFDVALPDLAEPPDGTRLEFEHHTDVYAVWRDDASSETAGWVGGDGGDVWCVYPGTVPTSWVGLLLQFGEALASATVLKPAGKAFPEEAA